jgi:hypothetical protein
MGVVYNIMAIDFPELINWIVNPIIALIIGGMGTYLGARIKNHFDARLAQEKRRLETELALEKKILEAMLEEEEQRLESFRDQKNGRLEAEFIGEKPLGEKSRVPREQLLDSDPDSLEEKDKAIEDIVSKLQDPLKDIDFLLAQPQSLDVAETLSRSQLKQIESLIRDLGSEFRQIESRRKKRRYLLYGLLSIVLFSLFVLVISKPISASSPIFILAVAFLLGGVLGWYYFFRMGSTNRPG